MPEIDPNKDYKFIGYYAGGVLFVGVGLFGVSVAGQAVPISAIAEGGKWALVGLSGEAISTVAVTYTVGGATVVYGTYGVADGVLGLISGEKLKGDVVEHYLQEGVHLSVANALLIAQTVAINSGGSKDKEYTVKSNSSGKQKSNPLEKIEHTAKVKQQMSQGDYHAFPEPVDTFGGEGVSERIVGGDQVYRKK